MADSLKEAGKNIGCELESMREEKAEETCRNGVLTVRARRLEARRSTDVLVS